MPEISQIEQAAKLEAASARSGAELSSTESTEPDLSSIPAAQLETWAKRLYLQSLKQQGVEDKLMLDLRIAYADRIFRLTMWWLIGVISLVVCAGISLPQRGSLVELLTGISFRLPDAVLIAFITTTTINVIALFLTVAGWLFPKDIRRDAKAANERPIQVVKRNKF